MPSTMVSFYSICEVRSFGHGQVDTRELTHCRSWSARTTTHAHNPGRRSFRLPQRSLHSARDPLSSFSASQAENLGQSFRAWPFSLQKKHFTFDVSDVPSPCPCSFLCLSLYFCLCPSLSALAFAFVLTFAVHERVDFHWCGHCLYA